VSVVFLNRTRNQGSKRVVGPVTLTEYIITPDGTPVSGYDAPELLDMLEEPCCGHTLPFDGKVRSFGRHVPTAEQLEQVPLHLFDLEPVAKRKSRSTRRRTKKKKVEPVKFEFEDPEPAELPMWQEDKPKEEEASEEVS
jgi:hypothetical protein